MASCLPYNLPKKLRPAGGYAGGFASPPHAHLWFVDNEIDLAGYSVQLNLLNQSENSQNQDFCGQTDVVSWPFR